MDKILVVDSEEKPVQEISPAVAKAISSKNPAYGSLAWLALHAVPVGHSEKVIRMQKPQKSKKSRRRSGGKK